MSHSAIVNAGPQYIVEWSSKCVNVYRFVQHTVTQNYTFTNLTKRCLCMARDLVRKLQYYGQQVTDFDEICCVVLCDATGDARVFQIFSKHLAGL